MIVNQPPQPHAQSPGQPVIAAPVLHSDRVIRVDYSPGIAAATAPKLPKNPGRALFAGAAAMAEGFGHVSNFLAGVAQEIGKAKTVKQVDDAELEMSKARGEYDAWRENAPADSWRDEWKARAGDLRKTLMEQDGLTDTARQAIDNKWQHLAVTTDTEIQVDHAKKIFRDAAGTTIEKAKQIAAHGQPGKVDEFLKLPEREPYVSSGAREQLVNDEAEAARNNDVAEVPQSARHWINNPEANDAPAHWRGLPVAKQRDALNAATVSEMGQRRDAFNLLENAVQQGKVKDMASFEAWAKDNVPKGLIQDGDRPFIERKVRGDALDQDTFNKLYNEVHSFTFNGDRAKVQHDAAELRMRIAKLVPGDYAQTLTADLDNNEKAGKTISDQRRTEGAKTGRAMLQEAFEMELITDETGAPINYKVNRFLADALTDADKLKAFGITDKDDLKALRALPDVARIARFKELMKARADFTGDPIKSAITDDETFNKFTPFTQQMFVSFLENDRFEDYPNKQKAALIQRKLVEEMEDGISAGTIKPDAESVTKWVGDHLRAAVKAKGAKALGGGAATIEPSLLFPDDILTRELDKKK